MIALESYITNTT